MSPSITETATTVLATRSNVKMSKIKAMRAAIKAFWCELMHDGPINYRFSMEKMYYTCKTCQRLVDRGPANATARRPEVLKGK